jgi:TMEM175 potassium channel family protein
MQKDRLNAFSDGVIAIIITIMVLELKVPHGAGWADLAGLTPVFLSYVLSFVYVAIYWNNHHHMLHASDRIDGVIMWANTNLLFWLSLVPFATGWMGENHFAPVPTALYGGSLLMPALAYYLLQRAIIRLHGDDGLLARALGNNWKAGLSPVLYTAAIALAFVSPWISCALYAAVAMMWIIPDRRVEMLAARAERADRQHSK